MKLNGKDEVVGKRQRRLKFEMLSLKVRQMLNNWKLNLERDLHEVGTSQHLYSIIPCDNTLLVTHTYIVLY